MTVTIDRKIATGLIGRAKTGDELLTVLDMIIDSFTASQRADSKSTKVEPTTEEIQF